MKKRTNPLTRRIPRELAGDWRKYLVVFLFLVLTIGFVSGMYVANESMMRASVDGVTTYKLEYGHFELSRAADDTLLAAIETGGKADVRQFYTDKARRELDEKFPGEFRGQFDSEFRTKFDAEFQNQVKQTLLAGGLDADTAAAMLDTAVAQAKADGTYQSAYSSAYQSAYTSAYNEAYNEAWAKIADEIDEKYADAPADETAEKALSDDFLRALLTQTVVAENDLEDYTPRYSNPAINFAPDDMGSDEAMGGVLLDILIVIIAFIFAVTINNTITKEAYAIGTLRASGYTRGELVRHYLAMPVIVTLAAACVGNALGYTVFKNVVVSMYYNSYSLPTYKTVWNPDAFLRTTLIPVVLMFVVNFLIITRMMRHTPLQFLRHDLKKARRKKALRLPNWSFFARFRLRIIYQNIANYLILFAGVFFIMVMLAMAIGMPSTLKYYQSRTADMMFTNYQYVLKSCEDENGDAVTTQNPDAEAFCMTSLVRKSDVLDEEVSVYGIADGSRYVQIDNLSGLEGNKVYISAPYADKCRLAVGDTFTLDEKYESKQYTFTVAGIYDRCQSIAVFLPMDHYRDIFDLDADAFSGFLSDTEITDIDEDNVATVITERDITKMADQLDHSMGSYMTYFQYLCVLLSAVLIYLLTKLIIEKNENAISMVKILGYENREIARLYLLSTTIVLVLIDAVSVWLGAAAMKLAWREIMFSYSGWFAFHMEPAGYVKMFVFVLLGYAIVTIFDFRRIRKIPMDEALKSAE